MTFYYDDYATVARNLVARVGKKIVIGAPLGIGKPIGFLNAIYRLAETDASIELTIVTALTLARPDYGSELERRLAEPIVDRLLSDYIDPLYEQARLAQTLPSNIRVIEFFLTTGKYLKNDYAQQNYINSSYSLVVRDALAQGINVIAQQVARSAPAPHAYSVSSNSDLFAAMAQGVRASAVSPAAVAIVAEVNQNLPFMYGEHALFPATTFTDIIDTTHYPNLFAIPHDELSAADHMIGLYASYLIKDDSCLQIGIGKLSNAVANALILRQQQSTHYLQVFKQLQDDGKLTAATTALGATTPFMQGLYASTEMLSDSYMELQQANILKKRVYDDVVLQRLLQEKQITEVITTDLFDVLLANHFIPTVLTAAAVSKLQYFGIFLETVAWRSGQLITAAGHKLAADLSVAEHRALIQTHCVNLGARLRSGKIVHAGFFLGTPKFYDYLRQLPEDLRQQFEMTTISRTNTLQKSYELLTLQRHNARFINSAMMVTLGGVIISDGLADMREVSGVGGQFDFVTMAHNIPSARSIITCRSTRRAQQQEMSNIVWDYPSATVPRFLRDIVVTEYGIADCRAQTDVEIVKNMLNVTDSRFQQSLLKQAKKAGIVEKNYQIPTQFQRNTPQSISETLAVLRQAGLCQPFPFGTELTPVELVLAKALMLFGNAGRVGKCRLLLAALLHLRGNTDYTPYLQRMDLLRAKTLSQWLYQKLVRYLLSKTLTTEQVTQAAT